MKIKNQTPYKRHPIHALELALRFYESATFAINLIALAQKRKVYLFPDKIGTEDINLPSEFSRFREFLLQATSNPFDMTKIEKYGGLDKSSLNRYPGGFRSFIKSNVSAALYRWNACSRRVFELSEDLELLLEHTDVKDVRISDVPWPFDTFVITLPDSDNSTQVDRCILISIIRDSQKIKIFRILLFPNKEVPNLILSDENKKRLLKLFKRERWQQLADALVPHLDVWGSFQIGHFSTHSNICVNTFIEDHFKGKTPSFRTPECAPKVNSDQAASLFRKAINLAIGLSYYLTTVSQETTKHTPWRKLPSSQHLPDHRSISNPAEIFTISSQHQLTNEERNAFRLSSKQKDSSELCAHFRRGHWRKPPGKGKDEQAEKIIWVRPTLVRRDRLSENSLPGGCKTIL